MIVPPLGPVFVLYRTRLRALFTACGLWLASATLEVVALGALYLVLASAVYVASGSSPGQASRALQYLQRLAPGVDPVIASLAVYLLAESAYLITYFLQRVVTQATSLRIRADYNQLLFDKYLRADFQYMLDQKHGEVMFRVLAAPLQLGDMAVALPQLLAQGVALCGVLVLMLVISAPMTIGLIALSLLLFAGYETLGRLWVYDFGHVKVRIRQRQSVLVAEALDGIKPFKVYGHLPRWAAAFQATCDEYAGMVRRLFVLTAMPPHVLKITSVATFVLAALIVIRFFPEGLVTYLPLITLYFVALQRLLPTVAGVAQARARLVENLPALELVLSELATPSETVVRGGTLPPPIGEGITFEGVNLTYPGRPQVLRDVSVVFRAGCCTAIVGPSGSGKSSILNLIVRLFDSSAGVIRTGGADLTTLDTRQWRERIGFVAQESFLFHATVADNIAFGRAATDAEIRAAAKLALADGFIDALPDGYDTIVGEQGLKLSGGQRQRIGIARAVLKAPSIVIFDEATNSLDGPSESAVQESIARVSAGRTVIVVAHRLASVRRADHIVVLDGGAIVEQGTHAELLAARGLYHDLYRQDPVSDGGGVDSSVLSIG
jgi:ABC-type multidrug transport system fused ATPase/permease subunit